MIIYGLSDTEWDQKLSQCPYADIFQTSFWKNLVCEFIGGEGILYLFEMDNKEWLVPCYTKSPWSKGYRLGSVGYGGPIPLQYVTDPFIEKKSILTIVDGISKHCQLPCTGLTTFPLHEWSFLDNRDHQSISNTQIISLRSHSEAVFNEVLTGNVRTTIRRAEQGSLSVTRVQDMGDVEIAHKLLCDTQNRVKALYTTPFAFFSALGKSENASIWCVKDAEKMIAMSLMLTYKQKAFHLFHGWNKEEVPPGTNQLLIWEMIKHAISLGCNSFNMGESHSEQLRTAKRRWGCKDLPILRLNF